MISKVFKIILAIICLLPSVGLAQYIISGQVKESFTMSALSDVRVSVQAEGIGVLTDSAGRFSIELPEMREYELLFSKKGYTDHNVIAFAPSGGLSVQLMSNIYELDAVEVNERNEKDKFGYLNAVEGTAIYAGKKSEVIVLDNVLANLSTNNAREIYAKVSGLNIWESESGLQLNIGGRGLNPNRAANFNVRQNGYDISADALGYPESYYTPPAEALESIQIVRGAASLQYGTQFGGLVNFIMKKPVEDKKITVVSRQSTGSYGLFNTFNSISGTTGKLGYYAFVNYKRADGWRSNSAYNSFSGYTHFDFEVNNTTKLGLEYTHLDYLEQQAGGLSDLMFQQNPRQSNRSRNWFSINWNLININFDKKLGQKGKLNARAYGLLASRKALGFRNYRPSTADPEESNRELIDGRFNNMGLEIRYLYRYKIFGKKSTGLIGSRTYNVWNSGQQGMADAGTDANFTFIDHPENLASDYDYPNFNQAFFLENIFYINDRFTITPGIRFEHINTRSKGYYREVIKDLAGNIIRNETYQSDFDRKRSFVIAGLGVEYKQDNGTSIYANFSQNYRAITFSDIHIVNPSFVIDTNISDEQGFSFDFGIRNQGLSRFQYDITTFLLNYDNRIGVVNFEEPETYRIKSMRTNIGRAVIYGLETYLRWQLLANSNEQSTKPELAMFSNLALLNSEYIESEQPGIAGNKVEFVPLINFKGGVEFLWQRLKVRLQATCLSKQYTDAANDEDGGVSAVTGTIPAFNVFDAGLSYSWKHFKLEGGVNNLADNYYFTRRATGYPGPGIIPSPGRSFYFVLQFKW